MTHLFIFSIIPVGKMPQISQGILEDGGNLVKGNHQGIWVVSEMRIYVEIDWRFKEVFPGHCVLWINIRLNRG